MFVIFLVVALLTEVIVIAILAAVPHSCDGVHLALVADEVLVVEHLWALINGVLFGAELYCDDLLDEVDERVVPEELPSVGTELACTGLVVAWGTEEAREPLGWEDRVERDWRC